MALSNPPAINERDENERLRAEHERLLAENAALRGLMLDDAVIRLRIGEQTYGVPLRDIGALLDAHLPAFVTGRGDLGMKEQTLRSGIKALIPMGLRLLASDVEAWSKELEAFGASPLPLPDLKARHADLLDYAVRYLAALILSVLASNTWEAQTDGTVEGPRGYIRLSGLSTGAASSEARAGGDTRAAE